MKPMTRICILTAHHFPPLPLYCSLLPSRDSAHQEDPILYDQVGSVLVGDTRAHAVPLAGQRLCEGVREKFLTVSFRTWTSLKKSRFHGPCSHMRRGPIGPPCFHLLLP